MEDILVQPPHVLRLIGHAVRWNLLQLLAHSDYRVHDLVGRLHLPQNLVSYHLKQLRQGRLVTERQSSADERSLFYSLELELFRGQRFDAIVTVCDRVMEGCPSFPDDPERVHWSFLDPASAQGTKTEQLRVFEQTSLQLTTRLRLLLILLQRKKRSSCES